MYLVDTYALIEWFVHGNENYGKYFEIIDTKGAFVTELTILELYHKVFHSAGKEKAGEILDIVLGNMKILDLNLDVIKGAAIFRSKMLKEKKSFSYTDSVNYTAAKSLGIRLLTGDNDFKGMDNVEFVK